jgi:hypothetical protein
LEKHLRDVDNDDWHLLAALVDDYRGLYAIPYHLCLSALPDYKIGDDIPTDIRKQMEVSISHQYERLYKAGLLDLYLLDTSKREAKKYDASEGLIQIRNLTNYDWTVVSTSYVAIATSPSGIQWLDMHKEKYAKSSSSTSKDYFR